MAQCRGYGSTPAHTADASQFATGKTRCKSCTAAYFADWRAAKQSGAPRRTYTKRTNSVAAGVAATVQPVNPIDAMVTPEIAESAIAAVAAMHAPAVDPDPITANGHQYRPDPMLVAKFDAVLASSKRGHHLTLAMHGPSGSGKTDGARYLAARAGLDFVKIDCKSIIDAEAFFGTRGVKDGATFYQPSRFAIAIERPGLLLLDEYTRVTNDVRDVLNPILDGTRSVLNPITGEVVTLHPDCVVMLAGNVGYTFTGTYDVDPALTTRVVVHNVGYPDATAERAILIESAGISGETADRLIRFGAESRANGKVPSVSTRELLAAAHLVACGLPESAAIDAAVISGASADGGEKSPRALLDLLWSGIGGHVAAEDATAQSAGQVTA